MQAAIDELSALRNLEHAIRACGPSLIMVSGQKQLEMLAAALDAVSKAPRTFEAKDTFVSSCVSVMPIDGNGRALI